MRRIICVLICLALLSSFAVAAKQEPLADQISNFMEINGLNEENFALSYFNTKNGEKYSFNQEAFFPVGDVWTLPLHMYYCLEESRGAFLPEENDPEYDNENYEYKIDGKNLGTCRTESILNGNKEINQAMRAEVKQYAVAINEEFGYTDAERLPDSYFTDNCYSTHFLMNCMQALENDINGEKYGEIIRLYAQRPSSNEGFKSDGLPLTQRTTIQIRGEEDSMVCAVAEVEAKNPYLLVCFVSKEAGGDRIMAELNALICEYNGGSSISTTDESKTDNSGRSTADLKMTGKTSNDFSGLWKWMLYALGGAVILAVVLYTVDILLKYIKRRGRRDG